MQQLLIWVKYLQINKMSHYASCAVAFQPPYKRGQLFVLKGAIKGQIIVYNALQFVTLYHSNILVITLFVTVRLQFVYNLLICN